MSTWKISLDATRKFCHTVEPRMRFSRTIFNEEIFIYGYVHFDMLLICSNDISRVLCHFHYFVKHLYSLIYTFCSLDSI